MHLGQFRQDQAICTRIEEPRFKMTIMIMNLVDAHNTMQDNNTSCREEMEVSRKKRILMFLRTTLQDHIIPQVHVTLQKHQVLRVSQTLQVRQTLLNHLILQAHNLPEAEEEKLGLSQLS